MKATESNQRLGLGLSGGGFRASFYHIGVLARKLVKAAPERMLWATNWPHPGQDPRPDDAQMLDLLLDWAGDEGLQKRILSDNPAQLYGY